MKNDTTYIRLEKLLSERIPSLTKDEYRELLLLLEENNPVVDEWLRLKWEKAAVAPYQGEELDLVLGRIRKEIAKEQDAQLHSTWTISRFVAVAQKAAAVLFLPLAILAGYLLYTNSQSEDTQDVAANQVISAEPLTTTTSQEYYSPAGTRSKITLKDRTTIWLNSSSRLLVSNDYGSTVRRVKLVGQAYFDVTKNPQKPFIVDLAKNMSLKVTGTTFSVRAYEDRRTIETVLISGTVFVNHGDEVVKMVPSQKVALDRDDDHLSVSTVADDSYKLWKDGVLVFKETPMSEVVATLEKWYNVKFHIQNSDILTYKFTARLDNCSLAQVLEYMGYSSPISCSVKERNVTVTLKK